MIKEINYKKLVFWGDNPRYGLNKNHDSPESAIEALFTLNQAKMTNLAKDIAQNGLIPSDLPIVMELPDGSFKVYEGNRRIACIYSLYDNSYLSFKKTLERSFANIKIENTPTTITCLVETDIGKVYNYIHRIHNGEQNGIGRSSWGTTESNILTEYISVLNNDTNANPNTMQEKSSKLDPHFILIRDFPALFTELTTLVKATNIDRILNKKSFKENLNIKDYSNITPKQAKSIYLTLIYAHEQSSNFEGGLSRKYNDKQITEELIPKYNEIFNNMQVDKHIAKSIKLSTSNTSINEGERIDLNSFIINNKDDFEEYTFKADNLSIDEFGFVLSTNSPGKYHVIIRGLIDNSEYGSATLSITIKAKKVVQSKISEKLFKHDFATQYIIDITAPLNTFIFQANRLNLDTFSYIANVCLRIVLEESLSNFIRIKNLSTTENYSSTLEKNLSLFKSFYTDYSKITSLDNKSKLGYNKIKDIINHLNPKAFSAELHPLAHNIKTVKKAELLNLGNRVSNILIIISEEIKETY